MKIGWKTAVACVVGGVLLGSVASVAAQTDPTPTPTPSAPPEARPFGPGHGPHRHGGPHGMKGAMRSESVYRAEDGTIHTVRTDRGEITAVDGRTLTIEEDDATSVNVTVDDDTRISRDGEEAEASDLEVGDHVSTMREKVGDAGYTTEAVKAISAERYAEMEAQRAACEADSASCPRWKGRGPRGRAPTATPAPAA